MITTRAAPWGGLADRGCGWWIDGTVDALADALARPVGALAGMDARGRRWMEDEFSWRRVGEMTSELYRWVVVGGTRPGFVAVD